MNRLLDALSKFLGVRFRCDDEKRKDEEAIALRVSDLRNLPPDLIRELLRAAELLDHPFCLEVVGRIADIDKNHADCLRSMVDKLQYHEILKLLDDVVAKENR